jgi:hypothetical protein
MARRKSGFDPPDDVGEPAPADLAAAAAAIAEEFPLVLDQTSLVLLDLDPGHLHAFWVLASEDLHRASAAFRSVGGTPELVIRLIRLNPNGGGEMLSRIVQPAGSRGDARFDLDNDDSTYQAELGLSAADGGWVLLARSNLARLPRAVGTPIPPWTDKRPKEPVAAGRANGPLLTLVQTADLGAAPESASTQEPATAHGPAKTLDLFPDGTSIDDQTHPPAAPPLAEYLSLAKPPDPGTRPARWVLAKATNGEVPQNSALEALVRPVVTNLDTGSQRSTEKGAPAPDSSWQPAIRIDWPWSETVPPIAKTLPEVAYAPGIVPWTAPSDADAAQASTVSGHDQMVNPEPPGPVSSFALGRGPEAPVIEAEVLVHISARPGTLVDVYGRPVRVGPSGRSTLRLPVTDLALLTALLGLPAGDV